MIPPIANMTVHNLGRTEWTAVLAQAAPTPAPAMPGARADRDAHTASAVALAPAAMSALIEAQEHMAGDATPTDRSLTAQKIDHILARLADAPPATPLAQPAPGGFSVQMLMAARQQLRETYA